MTAESERGGGDSGAAQLNVPSLLRIPPFLAFSASFPAFPPSFLPPLPVIRATASAIEQTRKKNNFEELRYASGLCYAIQYLATLPRKLNGTDFIKQRLSMRFPSGCQFEDGLIPGMGGSKPAADERSLAKVKAACKRTCLCTCSGVQQCSWQLQGGVTGFSWTPRFSLPAF